MNDSRRTLVRFRNVGKTYDGVTPVVDRLDLDIYEGEFLSLLGPSGSGKTTCLMMLAGFESPTSGEIWLGETLLNTTPPHKRNIGMVFQNYALFPHMTVAQNVGYALTVRRTPAAEKAAAVAAALDMVRMGEFAGRLPRQLSGGQQQRVALARALVFNPKLVLMDEPLGALDKRLREHMQIELKELHRELGVTFVYVTHDQSEALTMSDRVAVFDAGRIQQIDRVDALYETPSNNNVAGFVGDSNTFIGELLSIDGQQCEIALSNGQRLRGLAVGELRIGAEVRGCARPERLALLDPLQTPAPGGALNVLRAQSEGALYFGDHMRVRFSLPGQETGFVKVPLDNTMLQRCRAGDTVCLAISATHVRVFAHEPSTSHGVHHAH
ncbi:spermidine/putrescine ABC transporter ATPase [Paraburkholderia caffeinilytica]|uniref:Fe3+/spermidine/putrescine ABC transporter ATP-binding protein n=1 Tax=Paraburkholderia caffeinilytica TaxID=1761016 RepID=A0ABQ1LXQ3_9BURK|nr:ABC transporter ATP-binding protein [Paraburkholderia caffeinilytica]AXL53452.1 spermidine/putrescine ABC transporter ATPase [Paraburkholderia caffeinilytica]GGC29436.1 Fe3+/spermidine/putrescine ABC transporter ATP-binding protein [Paraburkholderia caffeinilytica]CAB3781405.1 Vitamin B12 import ATP-binding protein BtuD [Paraburkholderia caffeinilytica]